MLVEEDQYPTALEYHGALGTTASCAQAVERILHSRRELVSCVILTCYTDHHPCHALLLVDADGDQAIIKSGFTSGYGGAGPKGLSETLALLDWHGVELDEVQVDESVMRRVEASSLTLSDLEAVRSASPIRPQRLWDYILREHQIGPAHAIHGGVANSSSLSASSMTASPPWHAPSGRTLIEY
ncbi:hypothetical protein GCM10022281_14870 [Sphingomonas rosea]|uniref:Uncharacterized protein n=1 Tax=Sphingomonas rosea TaxID=335605 RepID=A0ABP7U422_9SPHN